ncbi:MAG: DUF4423 domain-containing protein, partial [Pseudomonadota bacterium]
VFYLDAGRWDGVEQTAESMTNYQKDISKFNSFAIDEFNPKERATYSLTVAANPEVLELIRQKIKNMTEDIAELCADLDEKKEVYQLQSNFFPLTRVK